MTSQAEALSELVSDFLESLRTWMMNSGDVDLSAGLSLSKKSLDSLGVPLALLLEHGVLKECGSTTYTLPTPLVTHQRAACEVHSHAEHVRKPEALDLADLCKRLQRSKAALEPSTQVKGVTSTKRTRRRLHPASAARASVPTLPGYDGDL